MSKLTSPLPYDPYAVWLTSLEGLTVVKKPAHLLSFWGDDLEDAIVICDGARQIVKREQLSQRHPKTVLEL